MARSRLSLSTGLPGLDAVFRGLMPGDNVVWQIESVADYLPFVEPFARFAREHREKLIYFRFARHDPLLSENDEADIHELYPAKGFEAFVGEIHRVISEADRGTLYLFDCLSDLPKDWKSDRMLANFFMLTCPYLYDRAAIAYFALLRNYHSFHAISPIASTTQILLDAFRYKGKLYIHPIKVQYRHSPTMNMLHAMENGEFIPVTQSCIITEILSDVRWSRLESESRLLGYWNKMFREAEQVQEMSLRGLVSQDRVAECRYRLLRMLISRERGQVMDLAEKYFTLKDLLDIRRRTIGTGLIGGKAVGMLLARAILRHHQPRWNELLEAHDSFYVGSDVFYTYLVENGYWWMVQGSTASFSLDDSTEIARRRLLTGDFPEHIVRQFADMLDYFGQSPIIVRSSSVLEDNFGNAFAGKYDSIFCGNQGARQKRLEDLLCAVRMVYASVVGEEALAYRARRNLLNLEEQMGLLIQRVSGATYGNLFFPQAAGVGFSFNPYVWDENIDPQAGILRLVFGMGTRAVDRIDDDYTRVVAISAPFRRPESTIDEIRQYTQRRVDVIDLEANQLCSRDFDEVVPACVKSMPIGMFAESNRPAGRGIGRVRSSEEEYWLLNFDRFLKETSFVSDMREMLDVLQGAYQYPVDTEFTVNFFDKESYRINVLQCRPLQVGEMGDAEELDANISESNRIIESKGPVIGKSTVLTVDWILYVVPSVYSRLPERDRYYVARLIGNLAHHEEIESKTFMLIGPGRWCTTTPSLGVPVSSSDIDHAAVLCEIVLMHEGLIPDVSLGTHFFNELVENDMLYLAVFPEREGHCFNQTFLGSALPNRLEWLLPGEGEWADAVRVLDTRDLHSGERLQLNANSVEQRVVLYRDMERSQ